MSIKQSTNSGSLILSLIRLKPHLYYNIVTYDFNPPERLRESSKSLIPQYLNDGRYYTPAFIVPIDSTHHKQSHQVIRMNFQRKVLAKNWQEKDLMNSKENIIEISAPQPKFNFCQICDKIYEVYDDHVKDKSHLRQARFSKANIYIAQMCKRYSRKRKIEEKDRKIKTKKLKKTKQAKDPQIKRKKGDIKRKYNRKVNKTNIFSTNIDSIMLSQQ